MLDPFVPLLTKSLGSRHIKVLSRTLQCLIWIMRMSLPSLGSYMNEISTHLFGLLRRYARAGAAVGSNRELVNSAFKVHMYDLIVWWCNDELWCHQAMTVILRDFRKQDLSEDELTVLLSFVEEDIYDHQRQSTAFPLLKVSTVTSISEANYYQNPCLYCNHVLVIELDNWKFFFQAILGRKFVSSEVFELMQSVCQLSITSDSEHVRQQCRQVGAIYTMSWNIYYVISHVTSSRIVVHSSVHVGLSFG